MGSFPYSSSVRQVSWCIFLLLSLLLQGSCIAIRLSHALNTEDSHGVILGQGTQLGRQFDFLPRGIPIPPSGPSKRHNDFVDSVTP